MNNSLVYKIVERLREFRSRNLSTLTIFKLQLGVGNNFFENIVVNVLFMIKNVKTILKLQTNI